LGTPATRAATIEGLIRQKYLFRNEIRKSELVVSNKGLALSDLLDTIGIKELKSPEMTGEWEYKLKAMEQGELGRDQFMDEIKEMTSSIVKQTQDYVDVLVARKFPDLEAQCPECPSTAHTQTDGLFQCKDPECIFKLKKHIASHELTEGQARDLINNGRVGPIETFKNRFGQPFAAELTLDKPKKVYKVNFVFEGDEERAKEIENLTPDQIICQCKLKDDSDELTPVYETERAFLCPAMAKDKNDNGTRISKTILQKEIPTEQGIKMFVEGKTDLMPGFISKKGRKFSAHLTVDRKTGKLGFEFAPRKAKKKKGEEAEGGDEDAPKVKVKKASTKKKTTTKKAAKKKSKKKAPKKKKAVKKKGAEQVAE
jgi:DNA topoisomerase-3